MKIATCTVSKEGYSLAEGNGSRINLFKETLEKAASFGIDLFVFPGGYLRVNNEAEIEMLAKDLAAIGTPYKVAFVAGVDIEKKEVSKKDIQKDYSEMVKESKLPFFGVAWDVNHPFIWKQRSINRNDQYLVCDEICREERSLLINDIKVFIMLCGEMFNERIRGSILSSTLNPIVVDLAHDSFRFRMPNTMKIYSEKGVKCFCSVHAQAINAMKFGYINGLRKSDRIPDYVIGNKPRIEVKIWDI